MTQNIGVKGSFKHTGSNSVWKCLIMFFNAALGRKAFYLHFLVWSYQASKNSLYSQWASINSKNFMLDWQTWLLIMGDLRPQNATFFYYGSLFWGFFYSLWRSEQWGDLKFFCKTSSRFLSWLLRHDGISLWGPPPYIHHNGVNSRKF